MPLTVSKRNIIKAAAFAGALTTLGGFFLGAWSFARPFAWNALAPGSEPPPVAGLAHVTQADQKLLLLTQNFQVMQQNQLFLANGFWTQQLAQAQDALRRNPANPYARQQAITAQQQLYGIQRQLYGRK